MDLEKRMPLEYVEWGEIINDCKEYGMTLTHLAFLLDLSAGYLSMIASGERQPQLSYPAGKRLLEIHEEITNG